MTGLGPWNDITPQTYQTAIQSGAQLGTTLRGQDIAAGESRDRLSLAYAQLQSQEERAAEQAQAKLTLAHATLQAKQEQQDLMMGYREQALKQQAQRDQELAQSRAASMAERQSSGAAMMDMRQQRLDDLNTYRTNLETSRDKNEKLKEAIATAPRLSPMDQALMGSDVAELKGVEKKIAATEPSGMVRTALHSLWSPTEGWVNPGEQEITDLKSQALNLRRKIASYTPRQRNLGLPASPTPAAATPDAAATPFKEGALIRSKKDGKLYRVKDGEPVPEEQ
jgi:hypothetical protein